MIDTKKLFLTGALALASGLATTLAAGDVQAQPADARVIQDLRAPGQLSLRLLPARNAPQRRGIRQWVFLRGAVIERAGPRPNTRLVIGVQAYYESTDGQNWRYVRSLVNSNSVTGDEPPPPTAEQVAAVWNEHLDVFFRNNASSIVGRPVRGPVLREPPGFHFRDPNNVSFQMVAEYDAVASYTEVERVRRVYNVGMRRAGPDQPWEPAGVSPSSSVPSEEGPRRAFTSEQINAMPRLNAILAGEAQAQTPEQSAGRPAWVASQ